MNEKARNINIEEQIDRYVRGQLTEKETHNLWVELLKRPDYIAELETEIDLIRFYQHAGNKVNQFTQYLRWFAAAAAVVLVVIGLNLFTGSSLREFTLNEISLSDNLATAAIMRSGEAEIGPADTLLNQGFKFAVEGNIAEAEKIYQTIIRQYPETVYNAKAHLNLGILKYNSGRFEASVTNFAMVISNAGENTFLKEQAYWYMGNAQINTGHMRQARDSIYLVYGLNGIHQEQALALLKKLDERLKK